MSALSYWAISQWIFDFGLIVKRITGRKSSPPLLGRGYRTWNWVRCGGDEGPGTVGLDRHAGLVPASTVPHTHRPFGEAAHWTPGRALGDAG